ncbi:uncharacterized protein IL334_001643 [Kwoniella shivajii]|uniref:Alpha/beta hydrolase fold-3 domain-containing protein n=1 Tax=Kwoniella shivajii TaxID=564305 RepID=A0ABZ1CTP2_9TREE|nr:hypothetical protein IL334_001643 [Kwoniella shivajii]
MLYYHEPPTPFSDHTYKVDQGVSCDLRIWPSDVDSNSSSGVSSPWIMYVHGGAFCAGKHYNPNAWVIPTFRPRGCHVVSVSYRFTPHVSLSQQVEDCKDAFEWCKSNLSEIIGNTSSVDIDNYVLIGESAGGLIVSLLPFYTMNPLPPKAIVNIYGPTDLTYLSSTSSTPINPVEIQPLSGEFSKEEVVEGANSRDPAKALTVCPFEFDISEETYRKIWGVPDFQYTKEQRFQYDIKRHLRTTRSLMDVLLRKEECKNDGEWLDRLKVYSPLHLIRNGTLTYPPTAFLHGKDDPVVNYTQAEIFSDALNNMGIDTLTCLEPGQVHEFDNKYIGPEVEGWDTYITPIAEFVEKYIK